VTVRPGKAPASSHLVSKKAVYFSLPRNTTFHASAYCPIFGDKRLATPASLTSTRNLRHCSLHTQNNPRGQPQTSARKRMARLWLEYDRIVARLEARSWRRNISTNCVIGPHLHGIQRRWPLCSPTSGYVKDYCSARCVAMALLPDGPRP
jgi:hypothetical protein